MKIRYTDEIANPDQLFTLYQNDGWNEFLKLPKESLYKAMLQSWHVLCVYDEDLLIGTGRIISDGVINGYICGIIVQPSYRNKGIGKEIVRRLVRKGKEAKLHIQLLCEDNKASYYKELGFEIFTVGMKYEGK
ncbi:GNAT family N-acetyltransferase [Bacillus sp. FJAT-49705]|uniref:GNAT family N-acetyltransferase n=1 Tax=Cytobacillus citreus TaxID=2833586 RepID=A0ABS5NW33_9BACI|nr:GNAT family N-acetyltransferase [Cytobacillus citreus]MBS4191941.1 GNAT family N-acetyltransferase [Cytobacillus citreus]